MPTAIRDQILAAIGTAVSADYGDFPARLNNLPVRRFIASEDTDSDDDYGHTHSVMPVTVAIADEATATDPDTKRSESNALLADIVAGMFADETFGALADGIEQKGKATGDDGKTIFGFVLFDVRYHTVRGDPYTKD